MLNIIGSVFKYSVLVVVVLVLSHIIQIRGVSISRHVEHALDWTSEFSPRKITRSIGSTLTTGATAIGNQFGSSPKVEKIDSTRSSAEAAHGDMSSGDEKELRQIIKSSKKR